LLLSPCLLLPPPPTTLFPYTTLFRSRLIMKQPPRRRNSVHRERARRVPRTQVLQNLNLRRPQVEPSALPSIGSKLERTRRSLRNRTRTSLRPTLHRTDQDQLGFRPRRLPIRLSQTRGYTKRAGISTRNHRVHHLVRLHLLGQIINSDYVHGAFSSLSGRRK